MSNMVASITINYNAKKQGVDLRKIKNIRPGFVLNAKPVLIC